MAKRKSLMDALAEYQKKENSGDEWTKEGKMGRRASKAKTNTQKAFSTKQFLKTDNVKTNKKQTRRGAGEKTPLSGGAGGTRPPRRNSGGGSSSSGGGTRKPKSTSGSSSSSSGSTNKNKSSTTGRSLPSNPQLHSQRPGKKDPESGVSTGRSPSKHKTGPSNPFRNSKGETRAEERKRKQDEYNTLQRRRRSTGSSNNKGKLIDGKLHEWKNGDWVKVRM